MSKPRRHRVRRVDFGSPEWSSVSDCPACGKKVYKSRKDARNAARIKHPNDRMSVYQCRSTSPKRPDPAPWHFGHLNEAIKAGKQDRTARYDQGQTTLPTRNECKFVDSETGLKCSLEPHSPEQPHLALTIGNEWVNIGTNPKPTPMLLDPRK